MAEETTLIMDLLPDQYRELSERARAEGLTLANYVRREMGIPIKSSTPPLHAERQTRRPAKRKAKGA